MTKVMGHAKVEMKEGFGLAGAGPKTPPLRERFLIPPLNVIDRRAGYWLKRRRMWLKMGIKSEEGRNEEMIFKTKEARKTAVYGEQWTAAMQTMGNGTSVFDPVLAEMCYVWFCPVGGAVLDPFAGGSVRGVVASSLGLQYTGIDLSKKQVAANRLQALQMGLHLPPNWIVGDSTEMDALLPHEALGTYDMVMTCPPYFDLEKYSKDPKDLSNVSYEDFELSVCRVARHCAVFLKPSRFACIVIQDVRDEKGFYRDMPGHFIHAFKIEGMKLYNDAAILQPIGTASLRVGSMFRPRRKLCAVHARLLVFCKGEPPKLGEEGLWKV